MNAAPGSLRDAARGIAPVLRQEAEQAERDNRLTPAATAALREAGLFRLAVPASFGGYELGMEATVEVVAEVAAACPSSAWVAAIFYVGQQLVGGFDDDVRNEVWSADVNATVCGSFHGTDLVASPAEGGQVISGRWPAASGCRQATWATVGVPVLGADGSVVDHGVALVPMTEMSTLDSWDVAGMRGTGSHTLVAENVFVPARRIRRFGDALTGTTSATEPLYRTPSAPVLLASAAPLLGTARAIFGQTVAGLGKPMTETIYQRTADSPGAQASLADAANLIDSAQLHLHRSARYIDETAAAGQVPAMPERARLRMDVAHAVQSLRRAAELLITVAGPGSLAAGKVSQRYWRDIETGSRHPYFNDSVAREIYGRSLAGIEEQITPLV